MTSAPVLGVRFDALTTADAARQCLDWAEAGEARSVYLTNAHGVVEALDRPAFADVLAAADLNLPDGMSIVRALRARGVAQEDRVYGPDLTLDVARLAAAAGVPVALYGSTERTLADLQERLAARFPDLDVAEAISPPFRPLSDAEDEAFVARLRASGARVVFVGLGCPRQEQWCHEHADRVGAVCLAVGAAFDFHAGSVPQAPAILQRAGLEWLFRLAVEPRRLWRRYLRVVPRFLWESFRAGRAEQGPRNPGAKRPA